MTTKDGQPGSFRRKRSGGAMGKSRGTEMAEGMDNSVQKTRNYSGSRADRFIPYRHLNDLSVKFRLLDNNDGSDDRAENSPIKEILRNELLGHSVGETIAQYSPANRNLFQFYIPRPNQVGRSVQSTFPYSLSPLSAKSQEILRSPRKTSQEINTESHYYYNAIFRAPGLRNDYHMHLIDWSSKNVIAFIMDYRVVYIELPYPRNWKVPEIMVDPNQHDNIMTSIAWNNDGCKLAIGTAHGAVHVMDMETQKRIAKYRDHCARVGVIAWNENVLSSGGFDCEVFLRDIRVPEHSSVKILSKHVSEVCSIKWSPDNMYLATGGGDNRLVVWDERVRSKPFKSVFDLKYSGPVRAIAWSPHQRGFLACAGGNTRISFCNAIYSKEYKDFEHGQNKFLSNLFWSKTNQQLVSTFWSPYDEFIGGNDVFVNKYPSMDEVKKFNAFDSGVLYACMSPDGEYMVAATPFPEGKVQIFKIFPKSQPRKQPESVLKLFTNTR